MGLQKRELERREALLVDAEDAANKAGYLERCEYHDDVTLIVGDDADKSEAFRFAAAAVNRANKGKSKSELKAAHAEMRETLDSVILDAAHNCSWEDCPNA